MPLSLVLLPVAAFLFGSIPFGLIIGRLFYRTDIRSQGSGNIGAMNALRTLGKTGAVIVLLLDALKGFVPALLATHTVAPYFSAEPTHARYIAFVSALAIIGHCFSPWLGFKGGKGVATSLGAFFGIAWPVGVVACLAWLMMALLTRYSSVSSMAANLCAAIALWFFTGSSWLAVYGAFVTLLIIYTHRENLERLRAGKENRITLARRTT